MEKLKKGIIENYINGSLLDFIDDYYHHNKEDAESLITLLSELHNRQQINIVEVFSKLSNIPSSHDFFSKMIIFEKILPNLNSSIIDIVECVKKITLEAGQDMAAHTLIEPLIELCKKNINYTDELFCFSLSNIDPDFDSLSIAIQAGACINEKDYVEKGINLLNNKSSKVVERALFSLGKIKYQDHQQLIITATEIINSTSSTSSDKTLSISLRTLINLYSQNNSLESLVLEFLYKNSNYFGEQYVHTAATLIAHDNKKLNDKFKEILFDICCHVKPENIGTINIIDYALKNLLQQGAFIECVSYIEKMFSLTDYKLSIRNLNSFTHEINNYPDTHLSSLVTRWLVSNNYYLCKNCSYIFDRRESDTSIKFNIEMLYNISPQTYITLAKRACGWFFIRPEIAIGLITSLIYYVPDDALDEINEIIFNPLFISYPGSMYESISQLKNSSNHRMRKIAEDILVSFDKYQDAVEKATELKELIPSEQDRHTYRRHQNRLMDDSIKQARSKSFLSSIFSGNESLLLYGNKSIHYIKHGEDKIRQEIPLQEISHSMLLASMLNLDPHGLNKMIFQFKIEGCN
ncbi:hypothetical protein [Aeromonas caviae]|uniref:hypothetical protein n=1 Tax=Aeromonas caviae TaxID=648 RepID=UPI002B492A7C|nr:hypothetical protein [Aeromonas caviae]